MAAIREGIAERRTFELEYRDRRADGTIGWTLSRAVPLLDASGRITEWFGAANDVTARKNAEAALRASEERLREVDRRKDDFLAMLARACETEVTQPQPVDHHCPPATTMARARQYGRFCVRGLLCLGSR
jgi:hypothetical protein